MTERELTKNICNYLKYQYKDVIFTVDASGLKLSIGQATQMKGLRSGRGLPDLLIFEPNKSFKGLFIELKKEGTKIFNREGKYATVHIEEQCNILKKLHKKGYFAGICIGFENAKNIIDGYMSDRKKTLKNC